MGVLLVASIGSASAAPAAPPSDSAASAADGHLVISAPGSSRDARIASHSVLRPSRAAPARAAKPARLGKYTRYTLRSVATKDMRGVEKSLYRGKYFSPAVEAKRQCIADRESEGHYDVVSPSGLYFGAYQVSKPLARGATWMMLKEHKRLMGAKVATSTLARLRTTPMNRWPRYWQDAAFSTIMNWEHSGSGAAHWAGGRWRC